MSGWNAGHPAIREPLQGVGRKHGKPVRPAAALIFVEIMRLLETCRDDLAGLRNRALFLVNWPGQGSSQGLRPACSLP